MHYQIHRQLTVAIENAPGRLAAVCENLGAARINIEGISIVDNIEQGVIRFLLNDPVEAKRLLAAQGISVVEADVLIVDVANRFGALAEIGASFATNRINIDYLYATSHDSATRIKVVFKVSDLVGAQRVLDGLAVD